MCEQVGVNRFGVNRFGGGRGLVWTGWWRKVYRFVIRLVVEEVGGEGFIAL